jgi:hypothetical protein
MTMTVDHWKGFVDFARLDKAAGGPDSHMKTVVHLSHDVSVEEKVWRAGLYAGTVYNVPTAEVLWQHWPWHRVRHIDGLAGLEAWIKTNWDGFGFRRERRAVRSPAKMAENIRSLRDAVTDIVRALERGADYGGVWDACSRVKYVGRYALLKMTETLRQMRLTDAIIPDLRPEGGWSPREGLSLLWTDSASVALLTADGPDTAERLHRINHLAASTQHRIAAEYGVELDNYEFQVFCCDYKQAWAGRQYPGRSLDSELEYAAKVCSHPWAGDFALGMWEARAALFPAWSLGERQGWSGVRPELGECWRRHGYLWDGSSYDYVTTRSLAEPERYAAV